jgi:hypothetical protein
MENDAIYEIKRAKTIAPLKKSPAIVAIGILAVLVRAAAFSHNPAAFFSVLL